MLRRGIDQDVRQLTISLLDDSSKPATPNHSLTPAANTHFRALPSNTISPCSRSLVSVRRAVESPYPVRSMAFPRSMYQP